MGWRRKAIPSAVLMLAPLLAAANWATCTADLNKVERAAEASAAAAAQARSASQELQKTEQDLRDNCLLAPGSSAIYGDRCTHLVREQGNLKTAVEARGASVLVQMDGLNRAVSDANASCGGMGVAPPAKRPAGKKR